MSVIVPAFLFLILINRTGLLREVTNWDSAPYHLTVFLLPAVFGLTAEGLVQAFIRHCGRSQAALCVVRNLGAGLLGLALVSVGFLGTSWFDNWLGEVVFLTVLVVIGASVFGLGSILNFRGYTHASDEDLRGTVRKPL